MVRRIFSKQSLLFAILFLGILIVDYIIFVGLFIRVIPQSTGSSILNNVFLSLVVLVWLVLIIPSAVAYFIAFRWYNNRTPDLQPTHSTWQGVIAAVIATLLIGGLVSGIFWFVTPRGGFAPYSLQSVTEGEFTTPTQTPSNPFIEVADVDWLGEPQKVQSVGFFTLIDQYYPYKLEYCISGTDCSSFGEISDKYEPKTTYYLVGTMKSRYAGSSVYLAITKGLPTTHVVKGIGTEKDIAYDAEVVSLFIKTQDSKFIVTNDYQNGSILCRGFCNQNPLPSNEAAGIISDNSLSLDKVGSGYEYTDQETSIKFQIRRTNHFFNKSGLYLVKDFEQGYAFYSNQDINNSQIKLRTVINPTFVFKLPTGLVADVYSGAYSNSLVYQRGSSDSYSPYSDGAQIIWTAEDKPKQLPKEPSDKGIMGDYTGIGYSSDYDGCRGNMTLDNSSSDAESLDIQNNLVQVATTDKGDVIYDIKNKDFKIFQQFWFWKVTQNGLDSVLTYGDYLALKPILIWKDRLGVYRMVFRTELVASKCWGEPLIYLYPEKQTDVQIKLSDVINLTESEPRYNNGWMVTAYPDGKIYDKGAKRHYPYLYWEGSAPVSSLPISVAVVSQQELHNYFEKELSRLGLSSKERNDFENYWEPGLNDSPYYQISFYDASELNKIAPLNINPQPTTLIRVLMVYERLNRKIDAPHSVEMSYQTPIRKGFTVVEWGGILHKEQVGVTR